jgi:predicted  nucleic acid-binding Zn-ribbon protein
MVDTTDIEKKSLEAHVELCAERYNALEEKIVNLDDKITSVSTMIKEVKECIGKMAEKSNDRLISWGIGIIGFLIASLVGLMVHIFAK